MATVMPAGLIMQSPDESTYVHAIRKKAEVISEETTSGIDDFYGSSFANKCELVGLKNKMNR